MSNDKKQTAVEWLAEVVAKMGYISTDVLEQAKAMEEEQIKNAYQSDRFPCSEEDAEQYYNETYKQQ
jgi:hypothetical protein